MTRNLSDIGINYVSCKEKMPPKDGTIILAYNDAQHRYDSSYFVGEVRFVKDNWVTLDSGDNISFTHWAPINPPVGCIAYF